METATAKYRPRWLVWGNVPGVLSDKTCVSKLPDKPSALIRVALEDLEKCEKDERYRIYMADYHLATSNGPCLVCLAGVVLAKTIGIPPTETYGPTRLAADGNLDNARKLYALDLFRCGSIKAALSDLRIPHPDGLPNHHGVTDYDRNPAQFKTDMRAMADLLESEGL
jgi:hypothetical protein